MVRIEMSTLFSCSTSLHTLGRSYTVWPQYTLRQTDRRQTDDLSDPIALIGISRLCNCIGGLKRNIFPVFCLTPVRDFVTVFAYSAASKRTLRTLFTLLVSREAVLRFFQTAWRLHAACVSTATCFHQSASN